MSSPKTPVSTAPAPSVSSNTSSSTLASGSGRPMTWAERLAGKSSSSASSNTATQSQVSVSRNSNGRPASTSVSASSSSQADSASAAPGNASIPASSSSKGNLQKNPRTSSNGSSLNDPNGTASSSSATSPTTVKSRIPASADSGWGEGESSMESNHGDHSRVRTQSTTRISSTTASESGQITSSTNDNANNAHTGEADTPSNPSEPVKSSPGPPKVNIWQVRKEEAAKKAAEQAKLRKEQEELQKQQEVPEASTSKLPVSNKERNDKSSADPLSSTASTTKSGKKKRNDGQAQSASAATASNGTSINNAPKGKDNNRKVSGNKQTTPSVSNDSRASTSAHSTSKAHPPENEISAPSITPANQSDWPSPSEEKEREEAEGQKKTHAAKGSVDGALVSDQTKSRSGTNSPSRSKKQNWKVIQPDITFNSPLPSRKSSDSSKPTRSNSKSPKQPVQETQIPVSSSSKDMSRNSSKQSNKAQTPSDKPVSQGSSHQPISASLPSSSASTAQDDASSSAPVMASAPVDTSAKSPTLNKNPATSPSLASKVTPAAKQQNATPSPLPSSLPAKPIGAPISDTSRSRLSPNMHGATPIRSRQSPAAAVAQGALSNSSTPASEITPAYSLSGAANPASYPDTAITSRSPSVGQAKLSPVPGFGMIPPVASGQQSFHPSIAPMPQYSTQSGRGKRGGINGNGGPGRNGGRGGNASGRALSYNYSRNQTPGAYGSNFTSPIMGHQNLYQPPQAYPGPLPPTIHFDQAQMQQSQYNPQFDPSAPGGAINSGMQRFYSPFMYPPYPGALQGSAEPPCFPVGSPSQQASRRPSLPQQQGRQTQQGFPIPPPPPRSTAPSEASQLSQPESPMPAPGLPPGSMPGGAPVFQAMPAGYPPQMLDGSVHPSMPFSSPSPLPPAQMNTIPPFFSPPQAPSQQIGLLPQGAQSQLAPVAGVPPPIYARPSPLYDYSFIMFPPDGTAFWVLGQIEFYFSADNLARDTFLRQSMDEEGWVDIALIASFKRLNSLTQDINLIRSMMELSFMCEVREMKVRTKEWKYWILPGARKVHWQFPLDIESSSSTTQSSQQNQLQHQHQHQQLQYQQQEQSFAQQAQQQQQQQYQHQQDSIGLPMGQQQSYPSQVKDQSQ